ncbi:hypothetical protein [Mycobacteroides abscessus]|uniref:hypothetical protein n=1 Tax=Mycobacteroides abscessus TaxID=36809 RepID=UPI000D3E9B45|nr:hypothetical protein [Mycobacteroides abscessus]PVA66192.1 hypothetical protein DDJ87_08670 [Mycobacteroides abscessus]
MTLHFDLHVNGRSIREGMTIQRTTPGRPHPDEVNTYVVQAKCDGRWYTVTVDHRYGDGPWVLVRKALVALEQTPHNGAHNLARSGDCARLCSAPGCASWGCLS